MSREKSKMGKDEKVEHFVRLLERSEPNESDRRKIIEELRSAYYAVNKAEMIAIAKQLLGDVYDSKASALKAIEEWAWGRVRARSEALRILQ